MKCSTQVIYVDYQNLLQQANKKCRDKQHFHSKFKESSIVILFSLYVLCSLKIVKNVLTKI